MNSTQAITRLRKTLGKKTALRDDRKPSSPEQRQQQQAARLEANARKKAAEEALAERRGVVLGADVEYQRLKIEYQDALAIQNKTSFGHYYRYTAGRLNGAGGMSFFHVDAEADTLAELVEKVEHDKAKNTSAA